MNTANTRIINDNFLVSSVKSYFERYCRHKFGQRCSKQQGDFLVRGFRRR